MKAPLAPSIRGASDCSLKTDALGMVGVPSPNAAKTGWAGEMTTEKIRAIVTSRLKARDFVPTTKAKLLHIQVAYASGSIHAKKKLSILKKQINSCNTWENLDTGHSTLSKKSTNLG